MLDDDKDSSKKKMNRRNIWVAALAAQVGFLTLLIILAAVLGGIALDARLGTRPWFTIGLLLASIPVSLVLMVVIARKTVAKIKSDHSDHTKEEDTIGKNS